VEKIGESPPFAPRTPSNLFKLVGTDKDLFLKGRRAESAGLGIGAFAYYRRVIEHQKNRLLDEIIRVASRVKADLDTIATLEKAKQETQFSKACETVKNAIPSVLNIKEHNPLTLLHRALSEGLHAESDEACLSSANDVRIILVELSERLADVMKDRSELDQAVSRLVNRKNQPPSSSS